MKKILKNIVCDKPCKTQFGLLFEPKWSRMNQIFNEVDCRWHWSATEKKLCLNLIRFYQHNLHLFPSLFAFNKIGLSKTRNNTTNAIQWSHIRFLYCWANSCFKAFLLPIDDQFSLWRTRKIRSYHWHCCCSLHSGSFKRKKSYSSKRIKEF